MRPAVAHKDRGPLLLFLLLSALTVSSCVLTYKTDPPLDSSATATKTGVPIYYSVGPYDLYAKAQANVAAGFDFPYPSRESYEELRRAFTETQLFSEAIAATSPPERGIFCKVDAIHHPQSKLAGGFNLLSVFLLTAFPAYSASSFDLIQFKLYVNGQPVKTYEYRVKKVKGTWIVFLPFAWINFFTAERKETFAAVARQFFVDAEGDGYFG
ncbi:hypothetical protein, partial [Petrachloros mirabilis]